MLANTNDVQELSIILISVFSQFGHILIFDGCAHVSLESDLDVWRPPHLSILVFDLDFMFFD